jgi:hypothetical protein
VVYDIRLKLNITEINLSKTCNSLTKNDKYQKRKKPTKLYLFGWWFSKQCSHGDMPVLLADEDIK